jgi:hypothetical protein
MVIAVPPRLYSARMGLQVFPLRTIWNPLLPIEWRQNRSFDEASLPLQKRHNADEDFQAFPSSCNQLLDFCASAAALRTILPFVALVSARAHRRAAGLFAPSAVAPSSRFRREG